MVRASAVTKDLLSQPFTWARNDYPQSSVRRGTAGRRDRRGCRVHHRAQLPCACGAASRAAFGRSREAAVIRLRRRQPGHPRGHRLLRQDHRGALRRADYEDAARRGRARGDGRPARRPQRRSGRGSPLGRRARLAHGLGHEPVHRRRPGLGGTRGVSRIHRPGRRHRRD